MLDTDTKRRIYDARKMLVGKVPDPKSQVEQITIALIYKFMDDMDAEAEELGGERSFFTGEFEKYGWSKLMAPGMGGHDVLSLYSEGITRMNENAGIPLLFRDIFKNAYLPYRDPETLKSFLKIIGDFEYDHSERLGDAFEYLLSVLGSQGDAGQFRTPRHIIDFMVEVMDPKKDETILDPACGTAGFLISSYKHILKSNAKDGKAGAGLTPDERARLAENIKGYDISPDMVRLSLVNLYLHGFTDPHIYEYDTLTSEDRWNEYANLTLANPPFMSPKGGIKPHKRFSVQSKRSEVLFVDYMAEHLTPNGRAAIIVPEGIIFQSGNAYKQLRKMLVDEYLFAVVSLPAGVFQPYSGVKTSILLMDKTLAKKSDSIMFVKIENDGFDLGAQRREIEKNDLPDAAKLIEDYVSRMANGDEFDVENRDNVLVVAKEKIGENGDWNLSGERYRENDQLRISSYAMVKIGDVFSTISGGTPLKKNQEYYLNGTIPWLKSGEVAQGFVSKSENYITKEGLKNSSAKIFPIDTVLVAMYGATAGQVGILKIEASTNQAICGILPNDTVLPEYLFYIIRAKREYLISLSSGGAQPNISQSIIRDLQIPLPPLEIQNEIVAEIEGYQKIIDGARAVVKNYKPHIRIGPNWEVVELGGVLEKVTHNINPQEIDGEVNYVGLENISKNSGELIGETLTEYNAIKSTKLVFQADNILYGKLRPNLNKVWLATHNGICSTDIFVIETKDNNSNINFYSSYLRSDNFNTEVLRGLKGAQLPRVGWQYFSKIKIPLPPLETQNQIVARIEKEQALVDANKELITIFDQKIKDKIASVWGE